MYNKTEEERFLKYIRDNYNYASKRCGIFSGIFHIIPSYILLRYDIEGDHIESLRKI